jgi:hypothetical protein
MTVSLNANKGNRFLGGADFSVFLFEVKEFLLASDETKKKKVEKCRGVAVLMFVW